MTRGTRRAALAAAVIALSAGAARADGREKRLTLTALEKEPRDRRAKPTAERVDELRKAVDLAPKDRVKRFALVRARMSGGDMQGALADAKAWREKDAYNLVVVRLLGDIYSELGDEEQARRTYSAIVELLPRDIEAQRALATVLKQSGDLQGAYDRLDAATRIAPDDVRIAFELADVAQRLGRADESIARFEAIVGDAKTAEAVRYPAKQRLAQAYAEKRRAALAQSDAARASEYAQKSERLGVSGGTANDLKVYLTWDTDRSDVDLRVTNPLGEEVFYGNKRGSTGDALFDDVTTGYGPESYTAHDARPGVYTVRVNYFSSRRSAFNEARGEVVVILHEGTAREERRVLPYRLFEEKQTVTVAKIEVSP